MNKNDDIIEQTISQIIIKDKSIESKDKEEYVPENKKTDKARGKYLHNLRKTK